MDNKSGSLVRVRVEKRHSDKKDSDYYVMILSWNMPNDETYDQMQFISSEEYMLVQMSVPLNSSRF